MNISSSDRSEWRHSWSFWQWTMVRAECPCRTPSGNTRMCMDLVLEYLKGGFFKFFSVEKWKIWPFFGYKNLVSSSLVPIFFLFLRMTKLRRESIKIFAFWKLFDSFSTKGEQFFGIFRFIVIPFLFNGTIRELPACIMGIATEEEHTVIHLMLTKKMVLAPLFVHYILQECRIFLSYIDRKSCNLTGRRFILPFPAIVWKLGVKNEKEFIIPFFLKSFPESSFFFQITFFLHFRL